MTSVVKLIRRFVGILVLSMFLLFICLLYTSDAADEL